MKSSLILAFVLLGGCASHSQSDDRAQHLFEIGQNFLMENEIPQSIRYLEEAQKLNPNRATYHMVLGLAYSRIDEWSKAKAQYQKALEIAPLYSDAWNNLSALYIQTKNPDLAIEAADKALSDLSYMTPELALANKSRAYYLKRDLEKSEEFIQAALKRNPNQCSVRILLSRIRFRKASFNEAFYHAKSAVDLCPDDENSQLWLAYLLGLAGKTEVARNEYESMIRKRKVGSAVDKSRKALSQLNKGRPVDDPSDDF